MAFQVGSRLLAAHYYLPGNHFYIGEVKYNNEILPGEQPPILDRALFEAIRQKALAQCSHRTAVLHGEAKTASAGSISRVPAADIEEAVVKSLKDFWPNKKMDRRPAPRALTVAGQSNSWSLRLASSRMQATTRQTTPTILRSKFHG